jgi:hypothetical protein
MANFFYRQKRTHEEEKKNTHTHNKKKKQIILHREQPNMSNANAPLLLCKNFNGSRKSEHSTPNDKNETHCRL